MSHSGRADEGRLSIVAPNRSGRRRLILAGGETVRVTSRDALRAAEIDEADESHPADIVERLAVAEPDACMQRALRILGYRDRSTRQLARALADDGYPQAVIAGITARLTQLDLLDDVRFAAGFARTKAAAGWGTRRIAGGLREAGVDEEISRVTLQEVAGDGELERALALARRNPPRDRRDIDRVIARLARRGFTFDIARKAAETAFDEHE